MNKDTLIKILIITLVVVSGGLAGLIANSYYFRQDLRKELTLVLDIPLPAKEKVEFIKNFLQHYRSGTSLSFSGSSALVDIEDEPNEWDRDQDGVEDFDDNCPFLANPPQVDSDFDGVGDACDETPNPIDDSTGGSGDESDGGGSSGDGSGDDTGDESDGGGSTTDDGGQGGDDGSTSTDTSELSQGSIAFIETCIYGVDQANPGIEACLANTTPTCLEDEIRDMSRWLYSCSRPVLKPGESPLPFYVPIESDDGSEGGASPSPVVPPKKR